MVDYNDRTEKAKRIAEIDAVEPSPSIRAQYVYSLFNSHPELTEWDLICFCVEYLGKIALMYPWLTDYVKPIARVVYTAHYLDDDTDITSGIESSDRDSRSEQGGERKADRPRTLFKGDGT